VMQKHNQKSRVIWTSAPGGDLAAAKCIQADRDTAAQLPVLVPRRCRSRVSVAATLPCGAPKSGKTASSGAKAQGDVCGRLRQTPWSSLP